MKAAQVVREITRRAWSFGVSVWLSPDEYVTAGNIRCGGYFDAEASPPVLAVACGCDEDRWLGTLLHEYSHLTQWAENATIWRDDRADWDAWLEGKRIKDIRARIAASRELEADCERRTVRLIKELQAPVDLDRYIRGANSYIHFYNVMAEKRKWYAEGRGPYSVPEVLAAANPTLDEDYSKTPKHLWDALLTCI